MPGRTEDLTEQLADARRALALAEADAAEVLDLREAVGELREVAERAGAGHAERAYALAARLAEVEVERDALRDRVLAVSADRDDTQRVLALRDEELAGWRARAARSPARRVRGRLRALLGR